MREINYRVWDTINGRMHAVDLVMIGHGATGYSYPQPREEANVGTADTNRILMQFTGLKDRNGNEIYEGDIVRITDKHFPKENTQMIRKVSFEPRPPACGFVLGDAEHDYLEHFGRIMKDDDTDWDVEIIGNIYETPKLLKE